MILSLQSRHDITDAQRGAEGVVIEESTGANGLIWGLSGAVDGTNPDRPVLQEFPVKSKQNCFNKHTARDAPDKSKEQDLNLSVVEEPPKYAPSRRRNDQHHCNAFSQLDPVSQLELSTFICDDGLRSKSQSEIHPVPCEELSLPPATHDACQRVHRPGFHTLPVVDVSSDAQDRRTLRRASGHNLAPKIAQLSVVASTLTPREWAIQKNGVNFTGQGNEGPCLNHNVIELQTPPDSSPPMWSPETPHLINSSNLDGLISCSSTLPAHGLNFQYAVEAAEAELRRLSLRDSAIVEVGLCEKSQSEVLPAYSFLKAPAMPINLADLVPFSPQSSSVCFNGLSLPVSPTDSIVSYPMTCLAPTAGQQMREKLAEGTDNTLRRHFPRSLHPSRMLNRRLSSVPEEPAPTVNSIEDTSFKSLPELPSELTGAFAQSSPAEEPRVAGIVHQTCATSDSVGNAQEQEMTGCQSRKVDAHTKGYHQRHSEKKNRKAKKRVQC